MTFGPIEDGKCGPEARPKVKLRPVLDARCRRREVWDVLVVGEAVKIGQGASLIFNGGVGNLPRSGKSCFLLLRIDHNLFPLSFFPQSRRRRGPAMCVALSQNSIFLAILAVTKILRLNTTPKWAMRPTLFREFDQKDPAALPAYAVSPRRSGIDLLVLGTH
ncbi:hypothetical protein M407DRAFT_227139 [Tulasnella calospora MUT 4182]|uniref:Uncharacterized protein n=1 Tax=Tulasnella calospora MUT 4182 TaxID=1051891 RepID=A0A0C3LIX5_9AGAM|nr:hypothetical protein M407DRAFT_227139 [Tulasnella calospora MUT 4182]